MVALTLVDGALGEDGCGAMGHQSRRKGGGELRRSSAVLLVAKGGAGRPWFAGAEWRPTATMAAMERQGEHEGNRELVREVAGSERGRKEARESSGAGLNRCGRGAPWATSTDALG